VAASTLAAWLDGLPEILEAVTPEDLGSGGSARFHYVGRKRAVEEAVADRSFGLSLVGTATLTPDQAGDAIEYVQPVALRVRYRGQSADPHALNKRIASDRRQLVRALYLPSNRVSSDVLGLSVDGMLIEPDEENQLIDVVFSLSLTFRER